MGIEKNQMPEGKSGTKKKNRKSSRRNHKSISRQCATLLRLFQERQRLNTFEIRNEAIPHAAGRVCDLRDLGHRIVTCWTRDFDSAGISHRIALYIYEGRT